jgi:outer membrane protein OmpA-like peptidoglycan-associated protein
MKRIMHLFAAAILFAAAPLRAQEEQEGCKDHALFTRFPNMALVECDTSQFDQRKFPVGTMPKGAETLGSVVVEGRVQYFGYQVKEGTAPPSGLQIMRNFENATKKAGGTIEGQWPGWCSAMYDGEGMPRMGNGCTSFALTMKFVHGGRETWAFLQAAGTEGSYQLTICEREAMKQEVAVTEMADKLTKEGFIALSVNFDTGKATIKADSTGILDSAAAALKAAAAIKVEVGGHTDNAGTPEGNLRLSQERAQAVMAALVQRGIAAARMTAKGYGQATPVADNRTEEGRAKNRRVELVKK